MNNLNIKDTQNMENKLAAEKKNKEVSGAYQKVHDKYSHGGIDERFTGSRRDDAAHVGSSFTPEKIPNQTLDSERNVRASNISPEEAAWFSRGEQSYDKLQSRSAPERTAYNGEAIKGTKMEGHRESDKASKAQMERGTYQNNVNQASASSSFGKEGSSRVSMGGIKESGNQRFSNDVSRSSSDSSLNQTMSSAFPDERYDARSLNNLISTLDGRSVSEAKAQLRQLRDENKIRDFRIIAEGGTRPFVEDKQRVLVTHNELGKVIKVELG